MEKGKRSFCCSLVLHWVVMTCGNVLSFQDGVDSSIFFLGGSGSGVSFHKHADAWNGVIYGRKRWFLYPPQKTPPGGKAMQDHSYHRAPTQYSQEKGEDRSILLKNLSFLSQLFYRWMTLSIGWISLQWITQVVSLIPALYNIVICRWVGLFSVWTTGVRTSLYIIFS